MAAEGKEEHSLPVSGIVAALLVAVSILTQQPQLESPRPAAREDKRSIARESHQNVDARLWQDPMAAVARYREKERLAAIQESQLRGQTRGAKSSAPDDTLPPDDRHRIESTLRRPINDTVCRDKQDVRILMAMVLTGLSEEAAEMRRRTRYAVVTGLLNAGYSPYNAEFIGYAHVPTRSGPDSPYRLPEIIPYEWFSRYAADGKPHWMLVLWLDQSLYYREPLTRLRSVINRLTSDCRATGRMPLDATVLGPVDTGSLLEIAAKIGKEPRSDTAGGAERFVPLRIVSASATGALEGRTDWQQYHIESRYTKLVRIVGSDNRLSQKLIDELRMRNLHVPTRPDLTIRPAPKPAVIVISEHDTDYGQQFKDQVCKSARRKQNVTTEQKTGKKAYDEGYDFVVKSFSYLRQIDGGHERPPSASRGAEAEKESEKTDARRHSRSHGPQHVDYLRRLVEEIQRFREDSAEDDKHDCVKPPETVADSGLGKPVGGSKRDIVAIAIFGNDVYDKLLVLRALKPAFPKALFLTTDLDARLLDPEESRWTRNLVVATNYGLALSRNLQGGTAPFRDGYQTATYLAALLIGERCAIETIEKNKKNAPWLREPLLFEIGRSEAIPLVTLSPKYRFADLSECKTMKGAGANVAVQPAFQIPRPPSAFALGGFVLAVVLSVALIGCFIWPHRTTETQRADASKDETQGPDETSPPSSKTGSIKWLVAILVVECGWIATDYLMDLTAGRPNPSPSMILGLLCGAAYCIGLWLLLDGLNEKTRNLKAAYAGLLLAAPATWLIIEAVWLTFTADEEPFTWIEGVSVWPTHILRILAAVLAMYSFWYLGRQSVKNAADIVKQFGLGKTCPACDGRQTMKEIWDKYVGGRSSRIWWTISVATLYFVLCVVVMMMLEAQPGVPVRGPLNLLAVQGLMSLVLFLAIALLVAVAMAYGGFIVGVVRLLARTVAVFSPDRVQEFWELHNLPGEGDGRNRRFIELKLQVELVVQRSRALTQFIYFPFAVFALWVVARSSLFDMWDTPTGLAIVLGLPFVLVIGCVAWLRVETAAFHRRTIAIMRDEMIRLRGMIDTTDAHIWQLERLFERVRDERRGSFQSLALQPLIRALLLPIGGISGIQILEHVILKQ